MPENAIVQSLSCVRLCDHMDHSRLPCPSLSSRACSYSSPLRRWCPNIVASYVLSSFVMGGPFWYQLTHHGHKQKFPVYQIYNEKKLIQSSPRQHGRGGRTWALDSKRADLESNSNTSSLWGLASVFTSMNLNLLCKMRGRDNSIFLEWFGEGLWKW